MEVSGRLQIPASAKTSVGREIKIGESRYVNKNCWLAENVNYPPSSRCQYCESRFQNCLFFRYLIISLILSFLILASFLLIEGRISKVAIISIFILILVYGYFFNKSTEKIVEANFAQKKAKNSLEELSNSLKQKVDEQTKDLQEKSKYLKELLEIKTDFLRVANHQLNTPISVMKNCFAMIKDGSYSTDKAYPLMEKTVERISSTVSDFWNAYELEGERMKMEPQKMDLAEIVNRLIAEKQRLQIAQERKLEIKVQEPSQKIPFVWCDYKKIVHVISNLLDNAVFYTRRGSIMVYYELLDNGYLKVNIKDTGVGIADDDKNKMFQKFSRGKHATDLRPDGSGLGLFIAKKIIEGNNGEITFSSEGIDRGSTFGFTLPIYKDQKTEVGEKSEEVVNREKKIMIFN